MAKVDETLPCPQCGSPTYSKSDEQETMIYCSKSDKGVLVCDATPIWHEEALNTAVEEENQRRASSGEEQLDSEKELAAKA